MTLQQQETAADVLAQERWSIGEVSKGVGSPVKPLRFYADERLVPPSGRSASGYRLYSERDIVKLELVRTLCDAGLGPGHRAVLGRDSSLSEALRLQLAAVEAHRFAASGGRGVARCTSLGTHRADIRRIKLQTSGSRWRTTRMALDHA